MKIDDDENLAEEIVDIDSSSDLEGHIAETSNGHINDVCDDLSVQTKETKSNSVVVDKAFKNYGKGKNKVKALDNLSIRVPHGSIYGLLGPSGCGKTTLLGCLVNRLKLDGGKIYLFGFAPGTRESAVPGGRVGYMPQDLALYKEFTIFETLQYIGRINQMQKLKIKDRSKFLVAFLGLPNPRRLISELSGGQQRRVSLAAALIHEPELLILDEPTVGVDPLLRSSIWDHLNDVAKIGNTTIVITTHYIEEARKANRVGLMRNGKLLEENSPQALLEHYGFTSLEKLFLKLCMHDGNLDTPNVEPLTEIIDKNIVSKNSHHEDENFFVKPWPSVKNERNFSANRCLALIIKNLIRMKRNIPFLLFSFILPLIQTVLFCITVGGTPHDLKVAVVNLDSPPLGIKSISDFYLNNLNSDTIKQVPYDNFDEGYSSVVDGKNWGLIFMNSTFTMGLLNPGNENKDGTIHVYMDNTNEVVSLTVKITLYKALEDSALDLLSLKHNNNDSISINIPLKMEDPVYATDEFSFRNFVAPGILVTTIYFMAAGLTSLAFIIERKDGLLERSWVSGVKISEVLLSYLCTQMLIMAVQITIVMVCLFSIFNIPCEGNMFWVVLLVILQGIAGMCYGLMISVLARDEMTAIQMMLGTFYPLLLISGIVWPLEGMPNAIRYIAYAFPQTFACEGIRAILFRGWNIAHFEVYIGYVITILWGSIYMVITSLVIEI